MNLKAHTKVHGFFKARATNDSLLLTDDVIDFKIEKSADVAWLFNLASELSQKAALLLVGVIKEDGTLNVEQAVKMFQGMKQVVTVEVTDVRDSEIFLKIIEDNTYCNIFSHLEKDYVELEKELTKGEIFQAKVDGYFKEFNGWPVLGIRSLKRVEHTQDTLGQKVYGIFKLAFEEDMVYLETEDFSVRGIIHDKMDWVYYTPAGTSLLVSGRYGPGGVIEVDEVSKVAEYTYKSEEATLVKVFSLNEKRALISFVDPNVSCNILCVVETSKLPTDAKEDDLFLMKLNGRFVVESNGNYTLQVGNILSIVPVQKVIGDYKVYFYEHPIEGDARMNISTEYGKDKGINLTSSQIPNEFYSLEINKTYDMYLDMYIVYHESKTEVILYEVEALQDPDTEKEVVKGLQNKVTEYIDLLDEGMEKEIVKELYKTNWDNFFLAPGSKGNHHAFTNGLAIHITDMCEEVVHRCNMDPTLNRTRLLAACLVHDFEKEREMIYENGVVSEYSMKGKLWGHILMVSLKIHEIAIKLNFNIESERYIVFQHAVIAHHGKPEWGSPVNAQTPEAIALHWIDQLDAKTARAKYEHSLLEPGTFSEKIMIFENAPIYREKGDC